MSSLVCVICGSKNAGRHFNSTLQIVFHALCYPKSPAKCLENAKCRIDRTVKKLCAACRYDRCIERLDPKLVRGPRTAKIEDASNGPLTFEVSTSTENLVPNKRFQCEQADLINLNKKIVIFYNLPFMVALGDRNQFEFSNKRGLLSILDYFENVDYFIDEYFDTGFSHVSSKRNEHNIDLSMEEAFLYQPRRLSCRTKMLWKAEMWIEKECINILHYIDWASHIQEVKQLDLEDKLRLLVSRSLTCSSFIGIHRTLKYADRKCILIGGNQYVPRDSEELEHEQLDEFTRKWYNEVAQLWNSIMEAIEELKLNDNEFILLRLISFFTPCMLYLWITLVHKASGSKLSDKGRDLIQSSQLHYQSLLIDYLNSKYERRTAIHRTTQIIGCLPLMEQTIELSVNQVTRLMMLQQEFQTNLVHTLYVSRIYR
ncbi:hypothetical protein M3Y96_01207000 [Aphelenchoides besseyi]|nr:hypothetical protein M3Y96_01207000 [Aphelenchoides besseyi]